MSEMAIETMTPPDPANVRLDPRLMTHQRMLDLAGDKVVRFSEGPDGLFLECDDCHWTITRARPTTPEQFCADVLRHWVMAHDLSLAGGNGIGS